MSPARAALEAARNGGKLPAGVAVSAAPRTAAPAAPAVSANSFAGRPKSPAPWEDDVPQAATAAIAPAAEAQKKTEAPIEAAPIVAPAASLSAPQQRPVRSGPVPVLNWDGNWPALAAGLPVRGVAQQLAQQSELVECDTSGSNVVFQLRVPLETLCAAGSVDKLAVALTEHFGKSVRVTTEIGVVEQTANAAALADRAERQRQAEETMQTDPFVQTLIREFGATIVPGSIRPV
jgi:DNA polymerase-3 subunit gamma/tau